MVTVCIRPPTRPRPSTTTTSTPPASASARAHASPAAPAPTTTTRGRRPRSAPPAGVASGGRPCAYVGRRRRMATTRGTKPSATSSRAAVPSGPCPGPSLSVPVQAELSAGTVHERG